MVLVISQIAVTSMKGVGTPIALNFGVQHSSKRGNDFFDVFSYVSLSRKFAVTTRDYLGDYRTLRILQL